MTYYSVNVNVKQVPVMETLTCHHYILQIKYMSSNVLNSQLNIQTVKSCDCATFLLTRTFLFFTPFYDIKGYWRLLVSELYLSHNALGVCFQRRAQSDFSVLSKMSKEKQKHWQQIYNIKSWRWEDWMLHLASYSLITTALIRAAACSWFNLSKTPLIM